MLSCYIYFLGVRIFINIYTNVGIDPPVLGITHLILIMHIREKGEVKEQLQDIKHAEGYILQKLGIGIKG